MTDTNNNLMTMVLLVVLVVAFFQSPIAAGVVVLLYLFCMIAISIITAIPRCVIEGFKLIFGLFCLGIVFYSIFN